MERFSKGRFLVDLNRVLRTVGFVGSQGLLKFQQATRSDPGGTCRGAALAQRLRSACAARCRLGMFKQWQANLDHGDIKKIVLGYDILGCERGSLHGSMNCWGSNLIHPETNGQCHPLLGRESLNKGRSMTFHDFLIPSDI